MKALGVAMISVVLGCAHRAPTTVHVDPTATPPEPAAACTVRRVVSGESLPEDLYVRAVTREYRYDARGRLLYAVDQPQYVSVRASWFFYDARDRLTHVHRNVDRVELPSGLIGPVCDDGPCPPPPMNDRDGVDEDYRYDEQNRLIHSVERFTRYDHQGGTWRDGPAASARPDPGSICDIDPLACPRPRVQVGGTFRPINVTTRTVELHYTHAANAFPASAHFSVLEQRRVSDAQRWHDRPLGDETAAYAYDIEPRIVTRYVVRDGVRVPDRRVERDDGGRALRETRFSQGDIAYEVSHRHDDAGRRVETVRIDRARGAAGRLVATYTYDPLGRLTVVRWTRAPDGWTQTSAYDYDAGCSSIHRVPEDPRGMPDPVDALEQPLDRFLGRP